MKKFDIKCLGYVSLQDLDFYNCCASEKEAFEKCDRADWILRISSLLGIENRLLALAGALCAQTVEHLMPNERVVNVVKSAIRFGQGEIDETKLKKKTLR